MSGENPNNDSTTIIGNKHYHTGWFTALLKILSIDPSKRTQAEKQFVQHHTHDPKKGANNISQN